MKLDHSKTSDASRGDVQCKWIHPRPYDDPDSYLCCAYKDGHEGPHHSCYDVDEPDNRRWVLNRNDISIANLPN